jgi:hypothetical protein
MENRFIDARRQLPDERSTNGQRQSILLNYGHRPMHSLPPKPHTGRSGALPKFLWDFTMENRFIDARRQLPDERSTNEHDRSIDFTQLRVFLFVCVSFMRETFVGVNVVYRHSPFIGSVFMRIISYM